MPYNYRSNLFQWSKKFRNKGIWMNGDDVVRKRVLLNEMKKFRKIDWFKYIFGSIFAVEALTLPTAVYSQSMASTIWLHAVSLLSTTANTLTYFRIFMRHLFNRLLQLDRPRFNHISSIFFLLFPFGSLVFLNFLKSFAIFAALAKAICRALFPLLITSTILLQALRPFTVAKFSLIKWFPLSLFVRTFGGNGRYIDHKWAKIGNLIKIW